MLRTLTFLYPHTRHHSWGTRQIRGSVTYTDAAVEVTLVVSKDSTLGVGGFRRDPVPAGEPWMRAGEEVVYEVPFGRHARDDSVAALNLALVALDDGSILRFHDAWSR
jgi:hypothetical protein